VIYYYHVSWVLEFFLVLGYFSPTFFSSCCIKFFISYGSEVVEPFWSFDQYFDFIAVLIFTTGLAFQVPVVQIVLGLIRYCIW